MRHLVLVATLGACVDPPGMADDPSADPADGKDDGIVAGTTMSWKRVSTVKAVPKTALAAGRYRIHLIDLGTGLSILIQGPDFTMLYDGGSGDDRAGITQVGGVTKNGNRLLAYLFAALGPSGPAECTPDGDGWKQIDRPQAQDRPRLPEPPARGPRQPARWRRALLRHPRSLGLG